jgi:hypothetical protein
MEQKPLRLKAGVPISIMKDRKTAVLKLRFFYASPINFFGLYTFFIVSAYPSSIKRKEACYGKNFDDKGFVQKLQKSKGERPYFNQC